MTDNTIWAHTHAEDEPQDTLEYVGFWARAGASLIDTLLLLCVTVPLTLWVQGRYFNENSFSRSDILINWVIPAALVIWLWSRLQATPGKLALGARIVDADTGRPPALTQLLIRYVGYFVAGIPLMVGIIWVAFDRRKQGWHDKMANTVVVRPAGKAPVRFSGAPRR